MTLLAYSARISFRDPDRFDITRKSGGKLGAPFAPSWPILRRALDTRRLDPERAWLEYVPAYLVEMRQSFRAQRAAWDALLARGRVVLVCYCTDAEHCHRGILRRRILPALGAVDCGEIAGAVSS